MKSDMLKSLFSYITAILFIGLLVISSCKESSIVTSPIGDGNNDKTKKSVINGKVLNQLNSLPLESVSVVITGQTFNSVNLLTDAQGNFSKEITISSNENIRIILYKVGFIADTLYQTVKYGENLVLGNLNLEISTSVVDPGNPASIYLSSVSPTIIGVKESGSVEVSQITFIVVDSTGQPLNTTRAIDVNFNIAAGPGGGESVSPATVRTSAAGTATVNLISGTKAGTVQVKATINLVGNTISSIPVSVTIHGGLPDYDHFSVVSVVGNFAGYNIFGLQNKIIVYVGDKYANPVRLQTAVYFTTTGGIVEGSTLTDIQGIGSVNLISAEPLPEHPFLGPGFGIVTASTIDENSNVISKSTLVLFSGLPEVAVQPTTFYIPNNGTQFFNYRVSDQNGNPLAEGTTISVTIKGTSVDVAGDINVVIPDTQDPSWTQFSFSAFDTVDDSIDVAKPAFITIKTTGPNGQASKTIEGTSN